MDFWKRILRLSSMPIWVRSIGTALAVRGGEV